MAFHYPVRGSEARYMMLDIVRKVSVMLAHPSRPYSRSRALA